MTRTTVARPRMRPVLAPGVAEEFVRGCESGFKGRMMGLVIGGVPLCLLGPLFVTFLVWMQANRVGNDSTFWGLFPVVLGVSLPIMFLVAMTVKGSILEAGAEGMDTDSLGGQMMARRAALPMLVLEVGNIGPRMIIYAWRRDGGAAGGGGGAGGESGQGGCVLAGVEGGVSPAKLLLEGEAAEGLGPLIGVLLFHELADVSKSGDRIWLTSEARGKLGMQV